jgi:hypothetical protein
VPDFLYFTLAYWEEVVRLAALNLSPHGIGSTESLVKNQDSLFSDPGERYDFILNFVPRLYTLLKAGVGRYRRRGAA